MACGVPGQLKQSHHPSRVLANEVQLGYRFPRTNDREGLYQPTFALQADKY